MLRQAPRVWAQSQSIKVDSSPQCYCLYFPFPCVYREKETPSSIPNLAVKLLFADDTASFRCGNVGRCRDKGDCFCLILHFTFYMYACWLFFIFQLLLFVFLSFLLSLIFCVYVLLVSIALFLYVLFVLLNVCFIIPLTNTQNLFAIPR